MTDEGAVYKVVRSDEGRYSLWPADRDQPAGWRDAPCRGTRAECLAWIRSVWLTVVAPSGGRADA